MVARLTPDQKVACSIHVGFNTPNNNPVLFTLIKLFAAAIGLKLGETQTILSFIHYEAHFRK